MRSRTASKVLLVFIAASSLAHVSGCARITGATDIPVVTREKSIAGVGSKFFYRRDVHSKSGDLSDSLAIVLNSKTAAVGAREDLLAFEGENGQITFWDVTENGDLWLSAEEPIAPDLSQPMRSGRIWVCYPTSDTGRFYAITVDTTIKPGNADLRTRVTYELEPLGTDSIDVGNTRWAVHKIHYRRVFDRWLNGTPRSDGSIASGVRSYVTELGVLAEQHDTITTPGYDYELSFKLYETLLK